MKLISSRTITSFVSLLVITITMASISFAQNKVADVALSDSHKSLANVVTVALEGADFTTPIEALASITDASATNTYLVVIAAGTYDLGAQQLIMKEYVDVTGSGQRNTILNSQFSNTTPLAAGSILSANNASLSNLTIENIDTFNDYVVGIVNDGTSTDLFNLKIFLSGADTSAIGIYNNESYNNTINNTIVTVINSSAGYGVYNSGSFLSIQDSAITVSDSSYSAGVSNFMGSYATLSDTAIRLSGNQGDGYGVLNSDSQSHINGSTITLLDGDNNQYGLWNSASSLSVLVDSLINVSQGNDYGVYLTHTSASTIQNSRIFATNTSVYSTTSSSNNTIIGSILTGPIDGTTTPLCLATVIDGNTVNENCF